MDRFKNKRSAKWKLEGIERTFKTYRTLNTTNVDGSEAGLQHVYFWKKMVAFGTMVIRYHSF